MRRLLVPFARRIADVNLLARATVRRDADLTLPPLEGLPAGPVVVIAPHPDDESIGCGGLLALADATAVVFLTGEGERRREGEAACAELGVVDLVFLGLREGRLEDGEAAIAEALTRFVPATVLVPWALERQADHAVAARLVARVVPAETKIWCYEVWSPLDPNRLVAIDAVLERKRRAIACHRSQTAGLDYVEATLGLNRYRSLLTPGSTYAEAYFECTPEQLRRLSER